jgi:dipeptidase
MPHQTANGHMIFAKNSDREPNEAQALVRLEARTCEEKTLRCTYIEIPQVSHTHEVILSKPFQMWGAEMGVNQYGLTIGNEAVFTKVKFEKNNNGLTGMDMLRLALERSQTAREGLGLIVSLLEQYGQNASGGYQNKGFYYHNSFILADATEAWVLETAGRQWVARKVKDKASISNGLTIGEDYDLLSAGAISFARNKGWLKSHENFNFQKVFSDPFMRWASSCEVRQASTSAIDTAPKFSVSDAFSTLRSHHQRDFTPSNASTRDVCMHATGLLCPNASVGSLVSEIRTNAPTTAWITGTSTPCLSVFKPCFIGQSAGQFLKDVAQPTATADKSFWWQAEQVFRSANINYAHIKGLIEGFQKTTENNLIKEEQRLLQQKAESQELDALSEKAFELHLKHLQSTLETIKETTLSKHNFAPFFDWYWRKQNTALS